MALVDSVLVSLMRLVIRIGGSVIASPPNAEMIGRYAEILERLRGLGHQFIVVVGGGSVAREFIELAREAGLGDDEQDEIAISVSRIFAQILAIKLMGLKAKHVPTSVDEATRIFEDDGIAFMGGLKPGMTTDSVAAMVASSIDAGLIVKATDQDGIYMKDPRKHPDARKIDELSFDELSGMLEEESHRVGIHQILDPEAVRILEKSRMETVVVNGFRPENIISAVNGEEIGTRIR